jgi:hypothetical protein
MCNCIICLILIMLIDLLAIGGSGFNLQNSFLKPLNQHELSIFWVGQFAPELSGRFTPV